MVFHSTPQRSAGNGCAVCPPGTYQPNFAQSVCIKCKKGTYSNISGAAMCTKCETSYFGKDAATSYVLFIFSYLIFFLFLNQSVFLFSHFISLSLYLSFFSQSLFYSLLADYYFCFFFVNISNDFHFTTNESTALTNVHHLERLLESSLLASLRL